MITPAYRVLHYRDFPCLLCLVCNRISYNPYDLRERYCSACQQFLDDIPEDFRQPHADAYRPGLLLEGAALPQEDTS